MRITLIGIRKSTNGMPGIHYNQQSPITAAEVSRHVQGTVLVCVDQSSRLRLHILHNDWIILLNVILVRFQPAALLFYIPVRISSMVLRQSIRFISEFMISLINTRYLDLFPLCKNALNTVFDFDTRLTGLIDCLVDWTKKDPSHKKLMFVFVTPFSRK